MQTVCVAVITREVDENLFSLVQTLKSLSIDKNRFRSEILVVINGSSTNLDLFDSRFGHLAGALPGVSRVFTSETGIPHARNLALEWSIGAEFDWLAFIDADCRPQDDWLHSLLGCAEQRHALVVAGETRIEPATRPSLFVPESQWGIGAYRAWHFQEIKAGYLNTAYTRNVIFRPRHIAAIMQDGLRFDEPIPNGGGSDVVFFRKIHQQGTRIAFCPRAVVRETYSEKRLTYGWHFKRRIRNVQLGYLRGEDFAKILWSGFLAHGRQKYSEETDEGPRVTRESSRSMAKLLGLLGEFGLSIAAAVGLISLFLGWRYSSYSDRWISYRRIH